MSGAFVNAMNTPDLIKKGVKGSDVYTEEGVGDLRVSFYTMLVRGLTSYEIHSQIKKILATGRDDYVQDLLVLLFQTRDIRGGKGERDLALHMLTAVIQERPTWALTLVKLVPEYGCWGDLWKLYAWCQQAREAIDTVVKDQFVLDQETQRPSLLAKWLPRESGKYKDLARHFANLLFPLTPSAGRQRIYRRTCATLNRYLDTTEVKMCGAAWSKIEPGHVPGRLMKRCKLAFFNQKRGRKNAVEERYPGLEDRVVCADHFRGHLERVKRGEVVMKGGETVMPHELVREAEHDRSGASQEILDTRQAQWEAIRAKALEGGQLGKIVPMCDFSGSMDGVPKEVCLALGILISELATPTFKDHILTFDSTPVWHSFKGLSTITEKVHSIGGIGQGLSTNFQAAADLILRKLVENKVAPEDAPTDLLVLTDMGFDQAYRNANGYGQYTGGQYIHTIDKTPWETHFDMIKRSFQEQGYTPPRIICWNLRAEYKDFHAKAYSAGVVQLSGWSPSALKALQSKGITIQTPYEGLRELLDASRYDLVRSAVAPFFEKEVSMNIDLSMKMDITEI